MEKELKVALITGICVIIAAIIGLFDGYFEGDFLPDDTSPSFWNFDRDLEGWDRTGTTLPWKTLSDTVEWHGEWGDGEGVIVMDACYRPTKNINASAGIKKTVYIPSNSKRLVADIVKIEQDGGIRFIIIDSSGPHILGEERLSGRTKRTVSYDISKWAGESVTLEIMAFGWGVATENCPETTQACCGEYIAVDKVEII